MVRRQVVQHPALVLVAPAPPVRQPIEERVELGLGRHRQVAVLLRHRPSFPASAPANAPAADQFGVAIPELADYRVTVTISNQALAGPPAVPSGDSLRIDVSVDHPAITPVLLSAYRTNYCPNPALC